MAEPSLFRDLLDLAGASTRSTFVSSRNFALRSVGEASVVVLELVGPVILAARFGGLVGWSGAEACILVGLARGGQGLGTLIGRALEPAELAESVRLGRLDQVLLRPVPPLLWLMTSNVQLRFLFRSAAGIAAAVVGAAVAGVAPSPLNVALGMMAVLACAIFVFAVSVLGAALTLHTAEGSEVTNLLTDGGLGLISFPLDLYGSVLRFVFTFLVPVGLCVYVPVLVMLGRNGPGFLDASLLAVLPVVLAVFAGGAALAWRDGLRHYRSTGS